MSAALSTPEQGAVFAVRAGPATFDWFGFGGTSVSFQVSAPGLE